MNPPAPRIGSLVLDGNLPVIAASFDSSVSTERLVEAKSAGLDLAELRVDLFDALDASAVRSRIESLSGLPLLATVRHESEGGRWALPESQRLEVFAALMRGGSAVDAVDIELRSLEIRDEVVRGAKASGRTVVISYHDFARTPELSALRRVVREAQDAGADIVKIAAMAHGDADVRTLGRVLLEEQSAPLVVIAMGPHGVKSRVFFPALGSRFTFAALGRSTAPGQLPLHELAAALRAYYPAFAELKAVP